MDVVVQVVSFISDLVTAIVGSAALYGLIFHRRELSNFFRFLQNYQLTERIKRIKETLGKLDSLNYGDKSSRAEIVALLGQVSGQVHPLVANDGELQKICNEISEILAKRVGISEGTKRNIVYRIHGQLDSLQLDSEKVIVKNL